MANGRWEMVRGVGRKAYLVDETFYHIKFRVHPSLSHAYSSLMSVLMDPRPVHYFLSCTLHSCPPKVCPLLPDESPSNHCILSRTLFGCPARRAQPASARRCVLHFFSCRVAQKIPDAIGTCIDLDPEDAAVVGARTEDEEPSNAGREHYIEVGPSALRKIHDSVSDPKYDGVRISRTELENSDSDHTNAESSDDVPDPALTPVTSEDEESQHEDAIDEDSEHSPVLTRHRQAVQSAPLNSGPAPHPQPEDELSSALKRTREEERKKGKAVSRQMVRIASVSSALLDSSSESFLGNV